MKERNSFSLRAAKKEFNHLMSDSTERQVTTYFGKTSIVIFIVLIFYSFITIGSTYSIVNTTFMSLSNLFKVVAIIVGIYICYIGLYFIVLQRKLNNKFIYIIAIIVALIAIPYFTFISINSLVEMF
jgi:cyanate permease